MRNSADGVLAAIGIGGLLLAALLLCATPPVFANGKSGGAAAVTPPETGHHALLRIRPGEPLPQTRAIAVGRNKSVLVELPRELRDVVVSSPEIMDAVLQSSNRVYLIGKKTGQSNAFFFDAGGQQILTLEVVV
ncbi:MAG TPA: pilus assembly protein N-terminal domain-containing protein, partial [Hyphomicrobiaceae bacterium]|nr:pilus assembly protein N-terminal domain-containing protein [Hyphomicrobiaceae bacterium]